MDEEQLPFDTLESCVRAILKLQQQRLHVYANFEKCVHSLALVLAVGNISSS